MKAIFLTFMLSLSLIFVSQSLTSTVYAACPGAGNNTSKDQALKGLDNTGSECDESGVENFVSTIVRILSYVVGIAAVIVIVLSGFKYITSAGDSAKISSAKNTLIYALIGLAIAVLAQFLVNFVFTSSKNSIDPPASSSKKTP